ncbi:hypothetical protein J7E99_36690 [Streptomyces sp. ISL-44]|uniref:hypothetical protein n=1 Tax=Streptomyces sp. ISL-44 TaxID=2819184 RepID=UPI001BE8F798|nr:hypothetical protein [Streptomyces sp. ISL-44]MBT2546058.1 hypothetical protein [Streptomyces sp. ISL-44]
MTATQSTGRESVRTAIQAATDRLLAGHPLRSSGRLSVSQLAIEAGVKRWHLTHQHLDLKELFEARVKAAEATPAAFAKDLNDYDKLKKKHSKLVSHCAELEQRLQLYATAINLLALENAALTGRETDTAQVVALPRPENSP